MEFQCGMAVYSGPLCEALSFLKQEHGPLRMKMEELLAISTQLVQQPTTTQEEMTQLYESTKLFFSELERHSEREEGQLFPIVQRYTGTHSGPIPVMEYEHHEAKRLITKFLKEAQQLKHKEEKKHTVEQLIEAIHILTNHFLKEENVLFPMAQQLLSETEKEDLLQAFSK
ncbi:hemerythrin domain-containing protein [Alkalihalobacterium bogoriense]|uniref:hemerythrin domain-containing protein n=1 Tax=Alkalihalobacterium bogoriense TaxID=246272 RepID=UPI00047ED50D|nr:hemerythrin domain-containing protein [Alkalihalobacterium bogoriense]